MSTPAQSDAAGAPLPNAKHSQQRMARPQSKSAARSMILMAAALAWGGGAGMLPSLIRGSDEPRPLTDADKERLRMAEVKRTARAAKKAENTRRANEGKRPSASSSAAELGGKGAS